MPWGDGRESLWLGYVIDGNGCHVWTGAHNGQGYGVTHRGGKQRYVHRLRYEDEVGPIPEGMVLDHFACDNGGGGCCNPRHVRPVSHRENALRSDSIAALAAAKTHCSRGHALSGDNLYICADGSRKCRGCDNLRHQVIRDSRPKKPPQTHCKRGHLLSGDNLKIARGPRRVCLECRRARARESYPVNGETRRAKCREYYHKRKAEDEAWWKRKR